MLMHRTSPGPHQWDWGGPNRMEGIGVASGRHGLFGTLLHPANDNPGSGGPPTSYS